MSKTNWVAIMKGNPDIKLGRENLTNLYFFLSREIYGWMKSVCLPKTSLPRPQLAEGQGGSCPPPPTKKNSLEIFFFFSEVLSRKPEIC